MNWTSEKNVKSVRLFRNFFSLYAYSFWKICHPMRLFKTIRFNRDLWSIDLWLNIFFIRTRRSLLFGNEVRTFPRAKFSKGLNFYSISFLCAILQYLPFKKELEILPIFNILFKRIFSSDTFKVLESK